MLLLSCFLCLCGYYASFCVVIILVFVLLLFCWCLCYYYVGVCAVVMQGIYLVFVAIIQMFYLMFVL